MRTSQIRSRAKKFAHDWKDKGYEKGQTQLFYRDFFKVFNIDVSRVAFFEYPVTNAETSKKGYIDLFWKRVLLVEQKSKGQNLIKAKEQAFEYLSILNKEDLPRYILLSNFQSFELYDLELKKEIKFPLPDLYRHVKKFNFFLGEETPVREDVPMDRKASELLGLLYDSLIINNNSIPLERFLVRIVFCLFADDSEIFYPGSIFEDLVEKTREDGSDLGACLTQLFQTLDTSVRSPLLDPAFKIFPHVNGSLFKENLRMPSFNSEMRKRLLDACRFDWSSISPAIFGSIFQSVMDKKERRDLGAHYTSEENILKTIKPLFLDDLWKEFECLKKRKGKHRKAALQRFQKHLGTLIFLDPACGCGNFLIIAYRELRLLEMRILEELNIYEKNEHGDYPVSLDASHLSCVDVNQFYGLEISEFPARIAEAALWMMDHQMNMKLVDIFGGYHARIPLDKAPNIKIGDALEVDWNEFLPNSECNYVFGNPPFIGAKMQSKAQREQIKKVSKKSSGTLDYVSAWFLKAADYIRDQDIKVGFVSTSSIVQGQQVGQLWSILFEKYEIEIRFAYQPFKWTSEGRGKARVFVVIVGMEGRRFVKKDKWIFGKEIIKCGSISPYLFSADFLHNPYLTVQERKIVPNGWPVMIIGSQPIDGGHYTLNVKEREELLWLEPESEEFIRFFLGGHELIKNKERWILDLQSVEPNRLSSLKRIRRRVSLVQEYRKTRKRTLTQSLAETPRKWGLKIAPTQDFLVIPRTTTSSRNYLPIGWASPPTIPGDSLLVLENARMLNFALLSSSMHMAWLERIGGRLGNGFRYSIGLVYNTFPTPPDCFQEMECERLESLSRNILDIRLTYPNSSLEELYDSELVPDNLLQAHRELDREVDRLYRRMPFRSNQERFEHLFRLYSERINE